MKSSEGGQMKKNLYLLLVSIVVVAIFSMSSCSESGKTDTNMFDEGARLFQQGKYDEAIEKYLEGLRKDPDNHAGYNLLGMAYRFRFNQLGAQKYKDLEIEAFKKAIELEPDFWGAYKNLAATLYYQGRKKEAVPYLEKALELQPNDPEKELILQWIKEGKKSG
jgi:tetratricopeptide (TPR) repeat protein